MNRHLVSKREDRISARGAKAYCAVSLCLQKHRYTGVRAVRQEHEVNAEFERHHSDRQGDVQLFGGINN